MATPNPWWRASLVLVAVLTALSLATPPAEARGRDKKPRVERRGFELLKPVVAFDLVQGYATAHEIGGVRIEVTLAPFELLPMYAVMIQERQTTWGSITGLRVGRAAPVWVGALPFYEITPSELRFHVRITNHLGRVLRLQGVAIQFLKDGKLLETGSAERDLNKVLILPEKSWEGVIHGPSLEAFGLRAFNARTAPGDLLKPEATGAEGTLLVGIYDVITELDDASNPTKRSNFEWIYAYSAQAVPEAAEVIRWKAKLTPEQAEQLAGEHPAAKIAPLLPGASSSSPDHP